MERTPVSSSNVASIGYDSSTLVLEVEFLNGSLYQYFDVPEPVFAQLMAASSVGGFLSAVIKESYRYARV